MALILNIDTSTRNASVCLADDDRVLQFAANDSQQDHASWLHVAIAEMLASESLEPKALSAIAVSIGPGSYTGLRVGLSAAKGLCYALSVPLIAVSTLEMLAYAVRNEASDLICPMIDARRMEVFCAVYNKELQLLSPAAATIIEQKSFENLLEAHEILFCGDAVPKSRSVIANPRAQFTNTLASAKDLAELSLKYFSENKFSDLAYTEPLYIKEFYSPERKPFK